MVAAVTIPEMALSDDEAGALAAALAEVEKHYPLNPLSDKHMAILGLVVCCGRIYGPRAVLLVAPKAPPKKPDRVPNIGDPARAPGAAHAPAPEVPLEIAAAAAWSGLAN